MVRSFAAVTLMMLVFGCGGGDDQAKARELCKQQFALMCNRTFTCPGLAARQTTWTSEDDCNAQTSPSCDGPSTCVLGTYHADKDQQCFDAAKTVTCSQLLDGTGSLLAPVCYQVCTT